MNIARRIKDNLGASNVGRRALGFIGYSFQPVEWYRESRLECERKRLEEMILRDQIQRAGNQFFFVQIGANDGASFDNLYEVVTKHNLRGVVVEPIRDLYRELCANYRQYPVTPVNVALHRTAKEIQMYRPSPEAKNLPEWSKATPTVRPELHKQTGIPSESIIEETVKCVTWDELLEQNQISRIDYLQIDTEGYDYEIMQMLDFQKLRPAIIKFEHNLFYEFMSPEQLGICISRLIQEKYHIMTTPLDVIAYSHLDLLGFTLSKWYQPSMPSHRCSDAAASG